MAITMNLRAMMAEALMEFAREGLNLTDMPEIVVQQIHADDSRYRVTCGLTPTIVTKDWLLAVGAGQIDPTEVLQQLYNVEKRRRQGVIDTLTIVEDLNVPDNQMYMVPRGHDLRLRYEGDAHVSYGTRSLLSHSDDGPLGINGSQERLAQQIIDKQAAEVKDIVPRVRRVRTA